MGGMNHRRPALKIADAGGGERVRTIAEDLSNARAADRDLPIPVTGDRCGACGSRRDVAGALTPRCAGCRADEQAARADRKAACGDRPLSARRPQLCSTCHTALPVTGACGFCS